MNNPPGCIVPLVDPKEANDANTTPNRRPIRPHRTDCGGRLFSLYHDRENTKFYIITEHDRSVTTVLLPEDY